MFQTSYVLEKLWHVGTTSCCQLWRCEVYTSEVSSCCVCIKLHIRYSQISLCAYQRCCISVVYCFKWRDTVVIWLKNQIWKLPVLVLKTRAASLMSLNLVWPLWLRYLRPSNLILDRRLRQKNSERTSLKRFMSFVWVFTVNHSLLSFHIRHGVGICTRVLVSKRSYSWECVHHCGSDCERRRMFL